MAARKRAELTQQQVAARLGTPQSYVSKYENGERKLDVIEFIEVCEALGLSSAQAIEDVRQGIRQDPRTKSWPAAAKP